MKLSRVQLIVLVTTAHDLAADRIVLRLRQRSVRFVRFNQEDFPATASLIWNGAATSGQIAVGSEVVHCADVRSAWFRYPAEPLLPAESAQQSYSDFVTRECAGFLFGFFETMPWFWMNRPSAVALAGNKLRQIAQAREFGLSVPETLVTNCAQTAREFVLARNSVVKTVTNAGISQQDGQYVVYTTSIQADDLADPAVRAAPIIFQERVANEFDLRVTVVGGRAFAARILAQKHEGEVDWRALDSSRVTYEHHNLPPEFEARCVAFVRSCSLTFAALDFIVTPAGEYVFLEINPSGQWGWIERATSLPISDAIVDQLMEGKP